jgi:very-short-patch-repair endonuclease
LSVRGRWTAAVLAYGPGAVLSHRAAAALHELRPIPSGPIDVAVPGRSRHNRPGIRVHNLRALHEDDRAIVDGIPVTSVHRTLLDYAEVARPQQLRLAIDGADRREVFDLKAVEAVLARNPGRRGEKPLRATLAQIYGPAPWTRSELERAFLALVRGARLPEPGTNVLVEGELVDCIWPSARLVVEVDSYRFHKSRNEFEADRKRDAKLMLAGCRVLRVTQRRIEFDAPELTRDLRVLLSRVLLSAGRGAAASGR